MNKRSFKIIGMDCSEEVAALKRELTPMVGEENLIFNIVESKMTVLTTDETLRDDDIRKAVARTGMKAVSWEEFCTGPACPLQESLWQRRGRLLLCVVSGVFITLGFIIHAFYHGARDALTTETPNHIYPLLVIGSYLAAVISGIWFIAPKAWIAARKLKPDMNLLMTVATIGAMLIGEWFEAATVTFLFALALLLESWSVDRARRAIKALMDLSPATARFLNPETGDISEKPVQDIPIDTHVLVRPGEQIPLDGKVVKGASAVNQAPITGESLPVTKNIGDDVFAGTINGDGSLEFRSTKRAQDTTLARIITMVEEAQARRAPSEQWVERFSYYYTPAMMILACLIALVPPLAFGGEWGHWFYQALVILVIACPCALVISTPVSIVAGLNAAARAGVLIKGGIHLESPARLRALALDKTGTLTYGHPSVQEVIPLGSYTPEKLIAIAAALEANSTHPLARAILDHAKSLGIPYTAAQDFTIIQGKGATGTVDGTPFWIGSHRLIEEQGKETPDHHDIAVRLESQGRSVMAVFNDHELCGFISVSDQIRAESQATVRALKSLGIQVIMLTGDNQATAQAVAAATGVNEFKAEMLPEDKVNAVQDLTQRFGKVAMVGDGVNDAPAMAAATLGIAMGAMGTDAAIETADIALMSDDLTKLPWLIRHSRRTRKIVLQNIVFSLAVKAVFIVMSLAGLATLWMAIAADMGASLLVIFNGLRLLKEE